MQNWELGGECLTGRHTFSRRHAHRCTQPTHSCAPFLWTNFGIFHNTLRAGTYTCSKPKDACVASQL